MAKRLVSARCLAALLPVALLPPLRPPQPPPLLLRPRRLRLLPVSDDPVRTMITVTDPGASEPIEIGLFRIAQELIANVLRHADATEASVQVMQEGDELRLTVEDNGIGFDMSTAQAGMGLRNIAARAAAIGGELHYESNVGQGTTVTVVVQHVLLAKRRKRNTTTP